MPTKSIPADILDRFQIEEHRHALTILSGSCAPELADIIAGLRQFELLRSEIKAKGGSKTKIVIRLEKLFGSMGWQEESSKIEVKVNDRIRQATTHSIDLCKGRIACEIQWNSKDGVFSRDLATLRLLHELDVISVGVIITRCDDLQGLFKSLGLADDGKPISEKYGASTTHWGKLKDRIQNSDAGMCPVLLIGIGLKCYRDDISDVPIRLPPTKLKRERKPKV
jgi:hypothetical protein